MKQFLTFKRFYQKDTVVVAMDDTQDSAPLLIVCSLLGKVGNGIRPDLDLNIPQVFLYDNIDIPLI